MTKLKIRDIINTENKEREDKTMKLTIREQKERIVLLKKFNANTITKEERKKLSNLTVKLVESFTEKKLKNA